MSKGSKRRKGNDFENNYDAIFKRAKPTATEKTVAQKERAFESDCSDQCGDCDIEAKAGKL
jgi:hypothetical protein